MWARGTCGERAGYDICGPGGVIFVWAGRSSAIFVWAGRQSTLSKTSPILQESHCVLREFVTAVRRVAVQRLSLLGGEQ